MNISNVRELHLASLVYVSRTSLPEGQEADAVEAIVSVAVARNAPLGVTGSLIYTELFFAQILEGPSTSLDELMNSIRKDVRHRDVTVVSEQRERVRRFGRWAMAYSGPSPYLDRILKPLISPLSTSSDRKDLVENLLREMERFHAPCRDSQL